MPIRSAVASASLKFTFRPALHLAKGDRPDVGERLPSTNTRPSTRRSSLTVGMLTVAELALYDTNCMGGFHIAGMNPLARNKHWS